MDTLPPPPPPFFTTPYTPIPQLYNNNNNNNNNINNNNNNINHGNAAYDVVPHHHPSSTPTPSIIIVIIVISSAIILSAIIYLLIRFLTRSYNHTSLNDVVSNNVTETNQPEHVRHHVISIPNNNNNNIINPLDSLSLPLFTFSSLTGKIAGADCAVCLSKFEPSDQLRLLPLCCHAFHAQCIDAWLKSNLTCPLCRSTVNPNDEDIINTLTSVTGGRTGGNNRSNSFRIEIGTVSQRRDPANSDRRSYSVGSFDYVVDDGYEIPVESTHRSVVSECGSGDKDSVTGAPGENVAAEVGGGGGGSGRFNWLRDYVDRVSVSLRGSGRFFTGSSRRSEAVSDFEGGTGRIGEEISELFRWLSGV